MMYLTDCSHTYATNNKLEEKVSKLLIGHSRMLIKAEELELFKNMLIADIDEINIAYPRCKPVKIAFENLNNWPNGKNDWVIRWNNYPGSNGKHIVEFKILASKEVQI